MRLDQALVSRGLASSRTEAQELIEKGCVLVEGDVFRKQAKQVDDKDAIVVTARRQFVSRGGEKLEGALSELFEDKIKQILQNMHALDVGSSTGGFTDCLLSHGVQHVDAVDVGTDQLHASLREDSRVSLFEQTDIRAFVSPRAYDIIVADLSFIPLESVFDTILKHAKKGTHLFLLIKPQFEVGKGNTKKGIVKDEALVSAALRKYQTLAETALHNVRVFPCGIQGGDGNQEYFLYGTA